MGHQDFCPVFFSWTSSEKWKFLDLNESHLSKRASTPFLVTLSSTRHPSQSPRTSRSQYGAQKRKTWAIPPHTLSHVCNFTACKDKCVVAPLFQRLSHSPQIPSFPQTLTIRLTGTGERKWRMDTSGGPLRWFVRGFQWALTNDALGMIWQGKKGRDGAGSRGDSFAGQVSVA